MARYGTGMSCRRGSIAYGGQKRRSRRLRVVVPVWWCRELLGWSIKKLSRSMMMEEPKILSVHARSASVLR